MKRRSFEVRAQRRREDRNGLSVIIIDLDGFKEVNDRFGHAAGDLVIQEMGTKLSQILRPAEIAGRMGGDEFLIVLPDTNAAGAHGFIQKLKENLREPSAKLRELGVKIGFSSGIHTETVQHGTNTIIQDFVHEADAAMYRDKRAKSA